MSHCCNGAPGGGPGAWKAKPLFQEDTDTMSKVKALEAEIADFKAQQEDCARQAKELAQREMRGEGNFAQEIHGLKQKVMVLATEAQHRKVRLNALLMSM